MDAVTLKPAGSLTPEEWKKANVTVALLRPIRDKVDAYFQRCYENMRKPSPRFGDFYGNDTHALDTIGLMVHHARNALVQNALDTIPGLTHVLFTDDDMTFPPDALQRLLQSSIKHDLPIVGGLCHMRRPPYRAVMAKFFPPQWGINRKYQWLDRYEADSLVEVDGTGGAFLLIRADVLRTMKPGSWFDTDAQQSEDLAFCTRARELGYTIHIDTSLDIGHRGDITIDRKLAATLGSPSSTPTGFDIKAKALGEKLRKAGAPVVTCVIPALINSLTARDKLDAAIESALAQTVPVEIVVVDDGSEVEITNRWDGSGVQIIRHDRNLGISAALNTGIENMKTKWFAWLSADDLWMPDKLEKQLAMDVYASMTQYLVVFADGRMGDSGMPQSWPMRPTSPADSLAQREIMKRGCVVNGSTALINREVFDAVGMFDTSLRYSQDWEMWRRISHYYDWHCLRVPLGVRREYDNLTGDLASLPKNHQNVERKAFEDAFTRDCEPGERIIMLTGARHGPT